MLELLCLKGSESEESIAAETEEAGEFRAEMTTVVQALEEVLAVPTQQDERQ